MAKTKIKKSTGHLFFSGEFEYFQDKSGDVFRAVIDSPIMTDKKRFGRFETTEYALPLLKKILGV